MPYRPRELVVRAREAATLLLRTLDQNELVQRFLDIYAAEFRRPGRADQPGHYREQLKTIRRESILAMVLRIQAALPAQWKVSVTVQGAKRPPKPKGRKSSKKKQKRKTPKKDGLDLAIPLLDMFREEFFVALGQALNWSEEEAEGFWHDLEVYEKLSWKEGSKKDQYRAASRVARTGAGGPFVDRVAFLLDPSLMEQARREAAKFQAELNASADRVLRRVFSRRRDN